MFIVLVVVVLTCGYSWWFLRKIVVLEVDCVVLVSRARRNLDSNLDL